MQTALVGDLVAEGREGLFVPVGRGDLPTFTQRGDIPVFMNGMVRVRSAGGGVA